MLNILYILFVLIMTVTTPFCETTGISYISLLIPFIFFGKREYILSFILYASIIFYRVPPGIPIMPLLIIGYAISLIVNERIQRLGYEVNVKKLSLFILSIAFLTYSCYSSITGSYDSLFKTIVFIALLYYATYDKNCDIKLLQRLLVFASVCGLIFWAFKISLMPDISMEGRRSISMLHNPNVVARGASLMIIIVFFARQFWDSTLPKILLDICIICGFLTIFFTGSRMGIMATIITMILCMYWGSSNKESRFIKIAFVGIILLVLGNIALNLLNIDIGRYATGFTSEIIEGDARLASSQVLWTHAISQHPIKGVGLGGDNSLYFLEYVPDADNLIIDILTQLGIIGLCTIVILLIKSLKAIKANIKNRRIQFKHLVLPLGILISQICFSLTETVFDELTLWYALAITYIYINSILYGASRIYRCS